MAVYERIHFGRGFYIKNDTFEIKPFLFVEVPRTIVITSIQPWDVGIGSNCKNIALELSKEFRVLYVNPPLDLKYFIFPKKAPNRESLDKRKEMRFAGANNIIQPNANLRVVTPTFFNRSINKLPGFIFDIFNKWTNKKLANTITLTLKKLGWNDGEFGVFSDSDMFRSFYLKDYLAPQFFAYYMRDNLMQVPFWQKHGGRYESKFTSKADICFANSPYLRDILAQWNTNSHYIGQGCDTDVFAQCTTTADSLEKDDRPLVGYLGFHTSSRLDIQLLEDLCTARTDLRFAFVGPTDQDFDQSKLHHLDNVDFYGPQPPEELATWVHGFDVCLNPQVVNGLTIGNYPRKIDEYLAAGKPVIATTTPTMEIFKDHVYLGATWKDYSNLIDTALAENTPEKRQKSMEFASAHTWKNSVDQMLTHLKDHDSKN